VAALIPYSEALRLDAELVRVARGASALRLAIGEALHALEASGGHHELGFSSLDAYARERCERSGRWAADTRALWQKLQSLPATRKALRVGAIGWSTAELLARHVTAESERTWLEKARGVTVRDLRALLATDGGRGVDDGAEHEPTRKLTVTAHREDTWLLECARKAAEAVAGPLSSDRLLQGLLAEGYSTLLELAPDCSELDDLDALECTVAAESEAHAAWCAERSRWRGEAEELCRERSLSFVRANSGDPIATAPPERVQSGPAEVIDRELRRLCSELAERDLALGALADSAHKAEVWRRLGFATELSYVRERLGASLSCLKAKRILASRAARVPELGAALATGRIGYEAAYLLSRVVTHATAGEWIVRAERRTVKHLREEVEAAELLIRMGSDREQRPLDEQSLDLLLELERGIVSGDGLGRARDSWAGAGTQRKTRDAGQMSGTVSAGNGANEKQRDASRTSGVRRTARIEQRLGRVTLRWSVTESTYRFWHALERIFVRVRARVCREPASFLRFLCENFCRTWLPALRRGCLTDSGALPEYFDIYRRDAFRCSSPVCRRRDVTPHHLVFRSHGGGDEDDNVASLCSWCHLHGVHEGRIGAQPPASRIRWRIGRSGTLRVDGRVRARDALLAEAPGALPPAWLAGQPGGESAY
jgi:hypothetical protein